MGCLVLQRCVLKGQVVGGGQRALPRVLCEEASLGLEFGEEEKEGEEDCHKQRLEVEMSTVGAGHWPVLSKRYLFWSRGGS